MSERGRQIEIKPSPEPSAPAVDSELQKKIAAAESRLATLAQVVGADFGMSAKFGKLGGGNCFNPQDNSVTLDPQIILEDKEFLAEFVAGHEGGHRAVTRGLEQIGVPKEKAVGLYKRIGFGYLTNCLEDCADNDWVGGLFPKFEEDCGRVYAEQYSQENVAMSTPEIERLISQLGRTPKFVAWGSEVLRFWATGRYSDNLDEKVKKVLEKTQATAQKYYAEIPGSYAREGERLKKAKERFKVFFEKMWPGLEELIKEDIDEEKIRQLAEEMRKQEKDKKGEKGGGAESLPPEMEKELQEKTAEAMREHLEELGQEIDKLKQKMEQAGSQEEKDKIAEQMAEMLGQQDDIVDGKKSVVPWDKLSKELKKKLQEIFAKLPKKAQEKLTKAAEKELEKLDDVLIKEGRGKLSKDAAPPTHEEIATAEAKDNAEKETSEARAKAKIAEDAANEQLAKDLQTKLEKELSEYDRIYQEIAPLADELFNRIHQLFLPKRHPRWQKGHPTGQRLDLGKVMQFQADRGLYDQLWERKTVPQMVDYKFTLLVDLSGSMQGEKIEQTFRGVILLAEVLNRLGIKTQIVGFQDELIPYKGFDEELNPAIRSRMTIMRNEVHNQGEHNQANWNSDGYCLGQASESLARQKGKDNFLVVLSDGQPIPDRAHSGAEYDLKKVVTAVRAGTRQKLIGVGLGPDTEHVATYYPTSLPSIDIKNLPQVLGELLEDMIDHPEKYR